MRTAELAAAAAAGCCCRATAANQPQEQRAYDGIIHLSLIHPTCRCLPHTVQGGVMRPRKAFYRARAHSNPFNDAMHLDIPQNPEAYEW